MALAPCEHMSTSHDAKLFRLLDAGEGHEVADIVLVGAASVSVVDRGEPFMLGREVGEAKELGTGKQPGARRIAWDKCSAAGNGGHDGLHEEVSLAWRRASKEVTRTQNDNTAPRMEDEEILVAADDAHRTAIQRERQELIVLVVTTIGDC